MNLQEAFERVKGIKQENMLLEGTYDIVRYKQWVHVNNYCDEIKRELADQIMAWGPEKKAPDFYYMLSKDCLPSKLIESTMQELGRAPTGDDMYISHGDKIEVIDDMCHKNLDSKNGYDSPAFLAWILMVQDYQISAADLLEIIDVNEKNPAEAEEILHEQEKMTAFNDRAEIEMEDQAENSCEVSAGKVQEKYTLNADSDCFPDYSHTAYNLWRVEQMQQLAKTLSKTRQNYYLPRLAQVKDAIQKSAPEKIKISTKLPQDVLFQVNVCKQQLYADLLANRLLRQAKAFNCKNIQQVANLLDSVKCNALVQMQQDPDLQKMFANTQSEGKSR